MYGLVLNTIIKSINGTTTQMLFTRIGPLVIPTIKASIAFSYSQTIICSVNGQMLFVQKRILFFCQKLHTWSLNHLQKVLLETIKNPVPIGFIYVQLPNEKSPVDIWPWTIWKDITSVYAGVFFRAGGGNAAGFGQIQVENTPRLIEVDTCSSDDAACNELHKKIKMVYNSTLPVGGRSNLVYTGASSSTSRYTCFVTTGGEVRLRNMAIQIWKIMS